MSDLRLVAAHKTYVTANGTITALDNVSVDFPAGLVTAVIGPSGCGKSTLLKACNGLVALERGAVIAFGAPMDYDALPALRRRMGYAVQGNGLFPHLSASDNITLMARLSGWSPQRIEQQLGLLTSLCQLPQALLAQFPHQLSGGQQQRVGLCRALMLKPGVLLLDEPFAAIDPITRVEIYRDFKALHSANPVTTVLVTHDMREALRLADHILVMHNGRLVYNRSKAQLLQSVHDDDAEALLLSLIERGGPA
jgi:osmoprotectant transport system ATP-binding protein